MAQTLHKLSPRHHRAIALRVAGESPQAIAEALGVKRRTVYVWFGARLVKDAVEQRLAEFDRLVSQRLADDALGSCSGSRSVEGEM